jgi:hypothetical protein
MKGCFPTKLFCSRRTHAFVGSQNTEGLFVLRQEPKEEDKSNATNARQQTSSSHFQTEKI